MGIHAHGCVRADIVGCRWSLAHLFEVHEVERALLPFFTSPRPLA